MKQNTKKIIKSIIKKIPLTRQCVSYCRQMMHIVQKQFSQDEISGKTRREKLFLYLNTALSVKIIRGKDSYKKVSRLLKNVILHDSGESKFFYFLDTRKSIRMEFSVTGNLTPDYNLLLEHSIKELKDVLPKNNVSEVWNDVEIFLDRCILAISKSEGRHQKSKLANLRAIKTSGAADFKDALQRILFVNMMIWQEGHYLVGLGNLDRILAPFYEKDTAAGKISREEAKADIKDFLSVLHEYYRFKSNVLAGDTGQIIILGGQKDKSSYFCNELTYIFIEAVKELQVPDPKILVRVSSNMPVELYRASLECIKTGIGSPLFSNDNLIIASLINFGIDETDAYSYATSACWEPFIAGKSSDANNISCINFAKPFTDVLHNAEIQKCTSYDEIVSLFFDSLDSYCAEAVRNVAAIQWEKAPLLSLFVDGCSKNGKDICEGGARYNDCGFTTVGLANVVNSFLNLKEFVFDKEIVSLKDMLLILERNYSENEEMRMFLKNASCRYGSDCNDAINLTKKIMRFASESVSSHIPLNKNFKVKIGLSSPSYIDGAVNIPATPDGRKAGEPLAVHISNERSDFHYLFKFSCEMDYGENRFNGNVTDIMMSPDFIESNFDKTVLLVKSAFDSGVFQMQFNVTSSKILISAKKNPEKFPNLIVRVWGFSAYFKDLPEPYKDVLISRVIEHERAC